MVYEGEPLARLAAQRLADEGIGSAVRPIGVGPGGWGMAANLPYAVDVPDEDLERAREVLQLAPEEPEEADGSGRTGRSSTIVLVMLIILAAVLVMSAADAVFEWLFS